MAGTDISHVPFTVIEVAARVVILAGCKLTNVLLMVVSQARPQFTRRALSIRDDKRPR